jgi:phosphoribosyl 1,2-cyclic phosphate phosphodiesterase
VAAYSCDAGDFPAESARVLADLDTWVLGALRHTPHPSHLSITEAIEWVRRVKPRRTVLTHLHADLDYRATAALLPPGIEPAYDGLSVEEVTD